MVTLRKVTAELYGFRDGYRCDGSYAEWNIRCSTQCRVQQTGNGQRATKRRRSNKQYSCSRFIILALLLATCDLLLSTCRSTASGVPASLGQSDSDMSCQTTAIQTQREPRCTNLPHSHSLQFIQLYSRSTSTPHLKQYLDGTENGEMGIRCSTNYCTSLFPTKRCDM